MGPLTGEASGLLITAIVGGAIIPELQGLLADRIGIHHAFVLPILCFLYIAWYGVRGSRVKEPVAGKSAGAGAGSRERRRTEAPCTLNPEPCTLLFGDVFPTSAFWSASFSG